MQAGNSGFLCRATMIASQQSMPASPAKPSPTHPAAACPLARVLEAVPLRDGALDPEDPEDMKLVSPELRPFPLASTGLSCLPGLV